MSIETLIAINLKAVTQTGEPHFIRDSGLLESAWARPNNKWGYEGEDDLLVLAVALMSGVAQNHPFQQGNKRTAFAAGVAFLEANGLVFDPQLDSAALADAFVAMVEHVSTEADFAELLRPHVRALA